MKGGKDSRGKAGPDGVPGCAFRPGAGDGGNASAESGRAAGGGSTTGAISQAVGRMSMSGRAACA